MERGEKHKVGQEFIKQAFDWYYTEGMYNINIDNEGITELFKDTEIYKEYEKAIWKYLENKNIFYTVLKCVILHALLLIISVLIGCILWYYDKVNLIGYIYGVLITHSLILGMDIQKHSF